MLGMASQPIFAFDCPRKRPPTTTSPLWRGLRGARRGHARHPAYPTSDSPELPEPAATRNSAALAPSLSIRAIHRHWGDFRPRLTSLLEFAYADLGPQSFQRLLLARLQRIDDRQADAFDEVMLGLQAGIADVMDQLKQVLDRQPGPAGRGDLVIYLRTLIDWLGFDPWPLELSGPGLNPVEIERKLRVTGTGQHSRETPTLTCWRRAAAAW